MNEKDKLHVQEDGKGHIKITNLSEKIAETPEDMVEIIDLAHKIRTTHATTSNDESSRSHAICQINIRRGEQRRLMSRLNIVDLAGSERAQDCQSNNRQRRIEGAEINKSLLALKECIRGLSSGAAHVP